jgi:DNA-binding protein H-NS
LLIEESHCAVKALWLISAKSNGDNLMADINLDTLSLSELKALQKSVAKAIDGFSSRKKTEAMVALEERAKELGFSLAELTGAKKPRKSSAPVGAKYRHPENAAVTWSGRGRQPGWFRDAVLAGKKPESMAVTKAD